MSDILNEIDEDLRKDRAKALWKRYGKYVAAVVVLVILAAGGHTWWQSYQRSQQLDMASRYAAAVETALAAEGNAGAAADQLEALAKAADGGYAMIARMRAAALRAKAGDAAAAAALYEAVAADEGVDGLYRDLADVLAIAQAGVAGEAATGDLLGRIERHTGEGAPWRFTARAVAAGLALKAGDTAGARQYLNAIIEDPNVPRQTRQRANEILRAVAE